MLFPDPMLFPVNSGRVGSPSDGASTTIHLISPYCPALALNRMEFPEGFSCRHSNPIRYVVGEASHQLHSAEPACSPRALQGILQVFESGLCSVIKHI